MPRLRDMRALAREWGASGWIEAADSLSAAMITCSADPATSFFAFSDPRFTPVKLDAELRRLRERRLSPRVIEVRVVRDGLLVGLDERRRPVLRRLFEIDVVEPNLDYDFTTDRTTVVAEEHTLAWYLLGFSTWLELGDAGFPSIEEISAREGGIDAIVVVKGRRFSVSVRPPSTRELSRL